MALSNMSDSQRLGVAVGCLSLLAVASIILLFFISGGGAIPRVDLGNVPGWIGGFAGVAALLFARRAARAALAANRVQQYTLDLQREAVERQDDRHRQDQARRESEERRRQASQVSAWLAAEGDRQIFVLYNNYSGQPVTRATVRFYGPNNDNEINVRTLSPTSEAVMLAGPTSYVLGALEMYPWTWEAFTLNVDEETTLNLPEGHEYLPKIGGLQVQLRPVGIELIFTDRNNIRWARGEDGLLREVAPDYRVVQAGIL